MNILFAAALLLPAAALAQSAPTESVAPPAGVGVDRVTLHPGETKAFTLAPGKEHQLLIPTDSARPADHAVTISYDMAGPGTRLTMKNRTGHSLSFTILADPDGDGGFEPAGDVAGLVGDGTPLTRDWPTRLGTVNIGDFLGGPHGAEQHDLSGG